MRFPAKKNAVALKHRAISRQEKMAFSGAVGLSWDSPPPPTECADGRTYGCTDVRTDDHVTITSQPKFLGLIGYHISLAMELRWRALPAGSAKNKGKDQPVYVIHKSGRGRLPEWSRTRTFTYRVWVSQGWSYLELVAY